MSVELYLFLGEVGALSESARIFTKSYCLVGDESIFCPDSDFCSIFFALA